ncbi:unnamed protein product [Nezara viridula]|uniref:Uncharacterized protein n=1 Tax=Nezara viridula TaxID=85310 RepID=A0A9P0MLV4_NEZVI|nr:unnamed protein product [Nezara viridula]
MNGMVIVKFLLCKHDVMCSMN